MEGMEIKQNILYFQDSNRLSIRKPVSWKTLHYPINVLVYIFKWIRDVRKKV